jgi:hypothetical protein
MKPLKQKDFWFSQLNVLTRRVKDWMDGFPGAPAIIMLAILTGGTGCQSIRGLRDGSVQGPFHEPHNHHLANDEWSDDITVVAVMPLTSGRGDQWADQGLELMQPMLTEELARFDLFEAITITPDKLTALTGVPKVRPHDYLPNNFPAIIAALDKQRTDRKVCNAVLFCEMDTFRPYPPLAMGWKFRLFNLKTGDLVWAFDEVFNVGDPRVNNSLRRYMRTQRMTHMDIFRDSLVIDSPRVLARYSLTTALETMRKKNPKVVQETADNTTSR